MRIKKIKKGDTVVVLIGKDKGRKGKVEKIFPKEGKVLIPGINIVKKHVKPRKEGEKGGIVEIAKPLAVSKVALVCPKCGKPTRVGFLLTKEGKERICKKCQQAV
ncbi:MAG: 50S ribosomal protein L24 [Microgenomates group bacterium]